VLTPASALVRVLGRIRATLLVPTLRVLILI
jgi:hypothetical protein